MIGTNPNLPIPQSTDTYSVALAKIAAWLSAVGVSLADKATPSALNINTALDFGGNAATNITSVQLAGGNTPNVAGSLFYYQGEFYAIDSTGVIQLTANGQLNAASVGGIGGDYGGVNPAKVIYDNASGQYRFYTNGGSGAWGDLAAAHLVLEGASGTVTVGVDAALAVSRILNLKSLPSSGVGLIVYNSATSTIEDIAVTSPTTITVTCPIVTTQPVQASKIKTTANMTYVCPGVDATELGTTFQHTRREWGYDVGGTNTVTYAIKLPVGAVISAMKLFANKGSNATITLTAQMRRFNSATGSLNNVGGGVTTSTNAPGLITMSDATSTGTIAANEQWYVNASASGLSGGSDSFRHLEVTYTLPNGAA